MHRLYAVRVKPTKRGALGVRPGTGFVVVVRCPLCGRESSSKPMGETAAKMMLSWWSEAKGGVSDPTHRC